MVQSLIDRFYRFPRGQWNMWQNFGGYFAYQKMLEAERLMQKAAFDIQIKIPQNDLTSLQVSFLTGKKFWHQTIFCAYSLQKVTQNPIHFTFYDDGSLDRSQLQNLKIQVPNSTFVFIEEITEGLNKYLPKEKYPYLHLKRDVYKHIRKLTDVHAGDKGWKLLLDSDMLFWKEPIEMIHWLKAPENPFYITDVQTAYGYDVNEMRKLCGQPIAAKINVGAIGLKSENIDFEKLEYWSKNLETNFGTSYYLEQALTAMIIGDQKCTIGSADEYIVLPHEAEVLDPSATLHHYVAASKKPYFMNAWKNVLKNPA